MQLLQDKPGMHFCEKKVGYDRKLQPCNFFDRDVWFRGVIDFEKVDEESQSAYLVDYKTGKPFDKWSQLAIYALHTFSNFPFVQLVNAQFYWTQTKKVTKKVWSRNETQALWALLLPDLKQYKESFDTDTWQKRPSGLCKKWCPVVSCQHNGRCA